MKAKDLTEKDLDCLVAYRIDTCKRYDIIKTLRLLKSMGCSFSDIARGKELYEEASTCSR